MTDGTKEITDLSKYEIPVQLTEWGKKLAVLHFNPITGTVYANLADSFRMDIKTNAAGKADENIDDFITRVGERAKYRLGISSSEFLAKNEEKWKAFELDEAERIAGEKQADKGGNAIWDNPPRRKGQGRPKPPHKAEALESGRGTGRAEPVGETDDQGSAGQDDGGGRFAIFNETY